jgi:hypothetical protein
MSDDSEKNCFTCRWTWTAPGWYDDHRCTLKRRDITWDFVRERLPEWCDCWTKERPRTKEEHEYTLAEAYEAAARENSGNA